MYIDLFIIVVILWAIVSGWRAGFIKELFNLLGAIVGLLIAAIIYLFFHEYLGVSGSTFDSVLSVIAFFILVICLPFGLGFLCFPLTHIIKKTFLGLPNSILGVIVSLAKFLLIISFAFNTLENLHILNTERISDSHLYTPVRSILGIMKKDIAERHNGIEVSQMETVDTTYVKVNP